jgi:hypothetical protein
MFVGGLAVAVVGVGVAALGWVLRAPRRTTGSGGEGVIGESASPPDLPSYGPRPTPPEVTDR